MMVLLCPNSESRGPLPAGPPCPPWRPAPGGKARRAGLRAAPVVLGWAAGLSALPAGCRLAGGRRQVRRRRRAAVSPRVRLLPPGLSAAAAPAGREAPSPAPRCATLQQVIIIHRHGARFPSRPTGPEDLSWPQRKQFWESYRGHLTPVGNKQLLDLGDSFREHYAVAGGCLFADGGVLDGNSVACYTSNLQRTLQSSWSFLLGALGPSTPIFFAFRSDRVVSDVDRRKIGVPIFIEDAPREDDKLFHEWKLHDEYPSWRTANEMRSPLFVQAAQSPKYWRLVERLHTATGLEELAPHRAMMERLVAVKDVDTVVQIEEAHALPILPNQEGISFSPEELEMVAGLAIERKKCMFQESVYGKMAESYGRRGAGYLAHKVWRHLNERARGRSKLRLVEFSCHDTTLFALANLWGIELPDAGFAAHFVLELHRAPAHPQAAGASSTGELEVHVRYNPNPTKGIGFEDLVARVPPLSSGDVVRPWDTLPQGAVPLGALEKHCRIPEIEESFQVLADLMDRRTQGPTRELLLTTLEARRDEWLSLPQWRNRHLQSFQTMDRDNDGRINEEEVRGLLSEWGVNSDPSVTRMLWELFDRSPGERINDEEFYLMMRTLIGVRGNISSWRQGQRVAA